MMRWLVLGLLMGFAADAYAQPQGQTGQKFTWDYADADLSAGQVTRFELSIDGGPFATVGLPTAFVDAQTGQGKKSYSADIPAMTLGNHTFSTRACNTSMCGDSAPPFAFTFVIKPATPSNLRISGGPGSQ